MTTISLEKISKRFSREWIFRDLDYTLSSGNAYAVVGPNGSGKSTLLQVISGFLPASSGKVIFLQNQSKIEDDQVHQLIAIAAPYLELIEEYTLVEFLEFHFKFKDLIPGYSIEQVINILELQTAKNKIIKNFSSGMRQRVKLATCFFADVPVILLDEPTTNLDEKGILWYENIISKTLSNRLIVICSNQEREYSFCNQKIDITNFKRKSR